jgi:type IV pilus assembly protein PilW
MMSPATQRRALRARRPPARRVNPRSNARGFTFVELMVAIALGLFLIGGLFTLVQAMRRTNTNQSGLSQLQDNERMAMQLITDVVQSTGYFIQPTVQTAASSFPVGAYGSASFTVPGQALVGTGTWLTPGHVITTRFWTAGLNPPNFDNTINCTGNASLTAASFVNQISVANNYLTCTLWVNDVASPTVNLVPGITDMQILYGVLTGNGTSSNSVDTYLDATAVGTNWSQVKSVQVTLTFQNPLFGQPGQTQQFVKFTRTIAVMNKTGVTT